MFDLYRGYSIRPGPNDPGFIIRQMPDPAVGGNETVVGHAMTQFDAHAWIDEQIDGPPAKVAVVAVKR